VAAVAFCEQQLQMHLLDADGHGKKLPDLHGSSLGQASHAESIYAKHQKKDLSLKIRLFSAPIRVEAVDLCF